MLCRYSNHFIFYTHTLSESHMRNILPKLNTRRHFRILFLILSFLSGAYASVDTTLTCLTSPHLSFLFHPLIFCISMPWSTIPSLDLPCTILCQAHCPPPSPYLPYPLPFGNPSLRPSKCRGFATPPTRRHAVPRSPCVTPATLSPVISDVPVSECRRDFREMPRPEDDHGGGSIPLAGGTWCQEGVDVSCTDKLGYHLHPRHLSPSATSAWAYSLRTPFTLLYALFIS